MRFFAIAIVLSLLVLAPMGLAQQTQQPATAQQPAAAQPANTPPTFSEQDRAAAKKQLQAVGELFGVKKSDPPPASATKQEPPATMAEVADKALNMVGNAVGTIAGIVQKVAPEVWEIMVRQQYAKAIAGIIVPGGMILLLWMMTLTVKRFWPHNKDQDYFTDPDYGQLTDRGVRAVWTTLVPTVLTMLLGIWFFVRLQDSVLYLINPKYYAVKDLLEMLLK